MNEYPVSTSPLFLLEQILLGVGYEARLVTGEELDGAELLLVALGLDSRNREMVMEVNLLQEPEPPEPEEPFPHPALVQMTLYLPFEVQADRHLEVCYLATWLSRMMPLGAFGFTPEEGLYFRYSLLSPTLDVEPAVLVEALDISTYFVQQGAIFLEQLATGYRDLPTLMKEVEATLAEGLDP